MECRDGAEGGFENLYWQWLGNCLSRVVISVIVSVAKFTVDKALTLIGTNCAKGELAHALPADKIDSPCKVIMHTERVSWYSNGEDREALGTETKDVWSTTVISRLRCHCAKM